MAGEKTIANSETTAAKMESIPDTKLAEQDKSSENDVIESDWTTAVTSSDVVTFGNEGSSGSNAQSNDSGHSCVDDSLKGSQPDKGSSIYYMSRSNPYAAGPMMRMNGGQQAYYTSGYSQQPVSYGPTANAKFNGVNFERTNGNDAKKFPVPSCPQPVKWLSKGNRPAGNFSSFTGQKQGFVPHNDSMKYRPNGRAWDHNDRYKKFEKNGESDALFELTCGPRGQTKVVASDLPVKQEEWGLRVHRDRYNLPDFLIEYENAKFYVIKSYSEDDVHKSIKYSVWSSTPNGNKKLDAAFRDAETKTSQNGTKCPVFLFFSVNGSGQFVGLAEMVGLVDFNKDMDFWQLDKWNGFFPVQWHVIKDIPNRELRHIILETNENRPVTHTRDTQEITIKQGLEMLTIFKNYAAKTSLLDDFSFYEDREKSLKAKKMNKPATLRIDMFKDGDFQDHVYAGEMEMERDFRWTQRSSSPATVINRMKNLSLRSCTTSKSSAFKNPRGYSS